MNRLSREGVGETLNHLQRLKGAGVSFKSFTEQYLDRTGVFRDAVIAILAAIAKQERIRLSERIKAGQARSSKKPGHPGRPGYLKLLMTALIVITSAIPRGGTFVRSFGNPFWGSIASLARSADAYHTSARISPIPHRKLI